MRGMLLIPQNVNSGLNLARDIMFLASDLDDETNFKNDFKSISS